MLLLFIGPTCAGKTTLEKELEARGILERLKSHTTRPKRPDEKGTEYYFVSSEEFNEIDFVETTYYMGNYYGTSYGEIRRTDNLNKDFVITVDKEGVKNLPNIIKCPVKIVGIDAPFEDLINRIKHRETQYSWERIKNLGEEKLNLLKISDIVINNSDGCLEESISCIKNLLKEEKRNQ